MDHWKREHKYVCKQRASARASRIASSPSPAFARSWSKWTRDSDMALHLLFNLKVQERAAELREAGFSVSPDAVARSHCLFIKAEYTEGKDLPFQGDDDCCLLSQDEFVASLPAESRPSFERECTEARTQALRKTDGSTTAVIIAVLVNGLLQPLFLRTEPKAFDISHRNITAPMIVTCLNSGLPKKTPAAL